MSEPRDWMPGYHLGKPLDLRRFARTRSRRDVTLIALLMTLGIWIGILAGFLIHAFGAPSLAADPMVIMTPLGPMASPPESQDDIWYAPTWHGSEQRSL